MGTENIVLTGVTGSLGSMILDQLLEAGHSVTAVLRDFKKGRSYLEGKYPENVTNGSLKFTEIPNMAVSRAFHAVAENATAIIQVATPLSTSNFVDEMIKPGFTIKDNILQAAEASKTVKRVIVTGSIVSTMDFSRMTDLTATFSNETFNPITLEQASGAMMLAYQYSKTSTEQQAWEYMHSQKRSFDLIVLLAPLITGTSFQPGYKATKDELGGISQINAALIDAKSIGFVFPWLTDIRDVAKLHVKSLDSSIPGNTRYLFYSHIVSSNDMAKLVRAKYPSLVARIPEPVASEQAQSLAKIDTAASDKVFGTSWRSWEDSVCDTIDDILRYEKSQK